MAMSYTVPISWLGPCLQVPSQFHPAMNYLSSGCRLPIVNTLVRQQLILRCPQCRETGLPSGTARPWLLLPRVYATVRNTKLASNTNRNKLRRLHGRFRKMRLALRTMPRLRPYLPRTQFSSFMILMVIPTFRYFHPRKPPATI